ncbi:alpha/beta hydrolase [Nocardioides sp. 616]|uniref:alpha/beta hydrolase n=1 Tax=Nocardioides sp. 616 TaxID=2268090 RepID=UPI000CE305FC|nr:alpha/beta hydrolase [Nocardioides sp. 616]
MKRIVALVCVLALVLGTVLVSLYLLTEDDQQSETIAAPQRPPASEADSAGATDAPEPDLAPYYTQQVEWSGCGQGFECGWLKVPMDYDEPGGKELDIALLKVLAGDQERRVGSLVVNPGGPGAPGTEYAAQASLVFREPLRRYFDIVGFDPRGTGRSNPVDCLSDTELDAYLASDPDPDEPAEEQEFLDWADRLGQGCAKRSGDLANHVSTVEAARDMDVLRAALGESELDYFGASYGTKLGATYAELFPERVGRMVLDGAVDVSATSRELSLGQAGGFELAIRSYVSDCVESGDCFLGDTVEQGLARIKKLLADIDRKPLPTSGDRELTVGNAFYGIVAPLYNRSYWPLLSSALRQAIEGRGDALMELSDLYSSRGPDGYTDNSSEAIYAINCLDDPSSVPADQIPQEYAAFDKVSPTFGRVFAWGLIGCEGFVGEPAEPLEIDGSGAAPILVIGTTRDPATPMEWAETLADQLESGVLVRRDGDGHTGYNAGNSCVDEVVEDYLLDDVVPQGEVSC